MGKPKLSWAAHASPFEVDGEYALDLLGYLEPIGSYENLVGNSQTMDIAGHPVLVIGLTDLIRIKEHLGRAKDRDSLLQLRAIKKVRDEEGLA